MGREGDWHRVLDALKEVRAPIDKTLLQVFLGRQMFHAIQSVRRMVQYVKRNGTCMGGKQLKLM
jgi:hypothetical protein